MKHLYAKPRHKEINNKYYVFDVETRGLDATPNSFVFGCIYGFNYRRVFNSHKEFEQILLDKRFSRSIIFAHNAAYDLGVMYGNIITNLDAKAIFNNRFICARRHKFVFADSFNVFPFSVKEIGKQIGLEKLELAEDLARGDIGEINEKHIEYCFRDCEIVWRALNKIFSICGSVRITLAGLALDYFKNSFIKARISYDERYIYNFFDSYYGGRVEAFKLGKTKAYKYDVNSMYPWAMRETKFPDPRFLKVDEHCSPERLEYLLKFYEGLAYCTIKHEKTKFGLLPYRSKENNKLIFPNGTFSGCWNFNELRNAIKSGKVKVINVIRAVYATPIVSPFERFVDTVYELRTNSEGIDKTIYKLILNSLYGKFAQRIRYSEEYHKEIPYEKIAQLQRKGIDYELRLFSVNREDCYLRIMRNRDIYLSNTIPLFSSYITSAARIRLLEYMEQNNSGLVYVDTDSICTTNRRNYNSAVLGEMKMEPEIIVEIFGNKSYREMKDEAEKLKLKGIPKSAVKIGENKFEFTKMVKAKEALRRKVEAGKFHVVIKQLDFNYDKRRVMKNGRTETLQISE